MFQSMTITYYQYLTEEQNAELGVIKVEGVEGQGVGPGDSPNNGNIYSFSFSDNLR